MCFVQPLFKDDFKPCWCKTHNIETVECEEMNALHHRGTQCGADMFVVILKAPLVYSNLLGHHDRQICYAGNTFYEVPRCPRAPRTCIKTVYRVVISLFGAKEVNQILCVN